MCVTTAAVARSARDSVVSRGHPRVPRLRPSAIAATFAAHVRVGWSAVLECAEPQAGVSPLAWSLMSGRAGAAAVAVSRASKMSARAAAEWSCAKGTWIHLR